MKIRNQQCFSLVEIMVATSVLSLMLLLLLQIMDGTMKIWRQSERQTDAYREARAALHFISRDLSTSFAVEGATNFLLGVPVVANATSNSQVYSVILTDSGKGDVCATGYYTTWDSGRRAYMLRRYFSDSDNTFAALTNGTPLFTPGVDEILAPYVWDFQVRSGILDATDTLIETNVAVLTNQTPRWVEIKFKAISPAAAPRLRALNISQATWFDTNSAIYRSSILPNSQSFSVRIPIAANIKP